MAKDQDFYTLAEMAALLRVQVSAVRARLSRNDPSLPPSRRVGGRRLFPVALYEEWRANLLRQETDSIEVSACPQRFASSERRS